MGKKNNRAAGKWYANREVVPGKRISKQTYYRWQKRVFEASSETAAGGVCGGEDFRKLQLPATGGSECEKSGLAATVRLGKLEVEFYHGTDERLLETVLRVLHHAK